jgi:hypothetical protein
MRGERAFSGGRQIFDRRRADFLAVNPQHHAVGEAAGERLQPKLQPRRVVRDVDDE